MTAIDRFDPFERRIADAIEEIADARAPIYLDDIFQLTVRTAQRRGWSRTERWIPMNRISILATAAVLAVVVGGIALFYKPVSNLGPGATPTPVPTAVPTASVEAISDALISTWLGAPRLGTGSSPRSELLISSKTISVSGELRGNVRADGQELVVTSLSETPCASSVEGRYSWSVSPRGTHLAITAVDDACAARAAAYAGDWFHPACHDTTNTCWGDLEAGKYPTTNFGPKLDPDLPPASNFGALQYTVPDGWTVTSDHTTDIRLVHTSDATTPGFVPDVEAWIRPAANVQTEPCSYGVDPDVGTTAEALALWVHGLAALTSTKPAPITIDGKGGFTLDAKIAATFTGVCEGFSPGVFLFAEGVGAAGPVGDAPWGVGITGSGPKLRLIFLDLGGGRTTMILIQAIDSASFDALVAEAMPIVESFRFE